MAINGLSIASTCVAVVLIFIYVYSKLLDIDYSYLENNTFMKPSPLKHSLHYSTIVFMGLREALYWAPILLRDTSLSDSECEFLGSRIFRRRTVRRKKWKKNSNRT